MIVFVMLDAFRHDYLSEANSPFLSEMREHSIWGSTVPSCGFEPDAAYLAGLSPDEADGGALYWRDPESSPFRWTSFLPLGTRLQPGNPRSPGRKAVRFLTQVRSSRKRLQAWASPAGIPFSFLPQFSFSNCALPFEEDFAGGKTIFDLLRRAGKSWFYHGSPFHNVNSGSVLDRLLKEVRAPFDYLFLHIGDLDGIGHRFGPDASETQSTMLKVDRCLSRIWEHALTLDSSAQLIVIGDHGMVQVKQTIDLTEQLNELNQLGFKPLHFLDSTMARFWCDSPAEARVISEVMNSVDGLTGITEEVAREFGLDYNHNQFWDLCWQADEGNVIQPNFFSSGSAPRGMHGYFPACRDNHAAFLAYSPHLSTSEKGLHLEQVDMRAFFHLQKSWLNKKADDDSTTENSGSTDSADTLRETPPARAVHGPYTRADDPAINLHIENQLNLIVRELLRLTPPQRIHSILLGGSFGRGSGSAWRDANTIHVVNDYDIVVVLKQGSGRERFRLARKLESSAQRLAVQLKIKQVDFSLTSLEAVKVVSADTIRDYEFYSSHKVIYGPDPIAADSRLDDEPDIKEFEGLWLLRNRALGLILAGLYFVGKEEIANDDRENLWLETAKAIQAAGDSALLLEGHYHWDLEVRLKNAQQYFKPEKADWLSSYLETVHFRLYSREAWRETSDQQLVENWQAARKLLLDSFQLYYSHGAFSLPQNDGTDAPPLLQKKFWLNLLRSHETAPGRRIRAATVRTNRDQSISLIKLLLESLAPDGILEEPLSAVCRRLGWQPAGNNESVWKQLVVFVLRSIHPGGEVKRITDQIKSTMNSRRLEQT